MLDRTRHRHRTTTARRIGTLIAAFSLAAGPTGLIAVAALLAGLRPLVMIVVKRARQVGLLAVLAPLVASDWRC